MDIHQQIALRRIREEDDGSSNIELVEYLVQDVGISLDEAWQAVRHRFPMSQKSAKNPGHSAQCASCCAVHWT